MKYYNYNELKELIVINKDYQEKFREQTDLESKNLKESLLYHKQVLEPLKICVRITGMNLIDGHHRWSLLPEVIEECAEQGEAFDLNIPVVLIKAKDAEEEMLRTQLGRRNLSNEDIAQYVNTLQQQGNTKTEAIKQTAKDLNISHNKVKNVVYPARAEQDRQRKSIVKSGKSMRNSAQKPPQTPILSLDKEEKLEESRQKRISKKMNNLSSNPINSNYYKEFEGNLLDTKEIVEYEDKNYSEEIFANGSKYRTYKDTNDYTNSEEYISGAPVNPNNSKTNVPEYQRLMLIEDLIKNVEEHLPYFEDSPIYSNMLLLVSNYKARVDELN